MNEKLIKAVIKQLGGGNQKEVLESVCNGGANGGFNGFIYYTDTIKFFKTNRILIQELAENVAEDLGEDSLSLIQTFNCLKDEKFAISEIAKVLYGNDKKSDAAYLIMNTLSWFALEEVARSFENE